MNPCIEVLQTPALPLRHRANSFILPYLLFRALQIRILPMPQPKETGQSLADISRDAHTLIEGCTATGEWFRGYLYPGDTSLVPLLAYLNDPDITPRIPLSGMDINASQRISTQIMEDLGDRVYYFSAVHTTLDSFWRIGADAANLARPDFHSLPDPKRLSARIITRMRGSGTEFDKRLHAFLKSDLGKAFDLRIDRTAQTFTITDAHLSEEVILNKWAGVQKIIQSL